MAKSVIFRNVVSGDVASTLDKTVTIISGDAVDDMVIVVPASTVDQQVVAAFTRTACKGYAISSDQDVSLQTNNPTTPIDTIAIKANEPLVWHEKTGLIMHFTVDVTAFYFTTGAITAPANIRIIIVRDATP